MFHSVAVLFSSKSVFGSGLQLPKRGTPDQNVVHLYLHTGPTEAAPMSDNMPNDTITAIHHVGNRTTRNPLRCFVFGSRSRCMRALAMVRGCPCFFCFRSPESFWACCFTLRGGRDGVIPRGHRVFIPMFTMRTFLCRISGVKRIAVLPENSAYNSHSLGYVLHY